MRKRKSVVKPKQKFKVVMSIYEQKYPFTDKPKLRRTIDRGTVGGSSLESVIESYTHKKQNISGLKQMLADKDPRCSVEKDTGILVYRSMKLPSNVRSYSQNRETGEYSWREHFLVRYNGSNHYFNYLTEDERKNAYNRTRLKVANTSNPIVNGNVAVAWTKGLDKPFTVEEYKNNTPPTMQEITIYKVSKIENKVMKTNHIKSNSKLAKWIDKRFEKYSSQLSCSKPRYFINRKDMVEKFGKHMMSRTDDCTCIGRCWYGRQLIWIDVNFHDKRWGDDPKEFRKNLDNTIAHEMVHLKFGNHSHPLHVDHEGSKRARAFQRRLNQVLRGKKYD
jgi:hypothetical protein